jgi:hypothetical protein
MKKFLTKLILGMTLVMNFGIAAPAMAQFADPCERVSELPGCEGPGAFERGGIANRVANVLIFLTGAVAVVMIIIGGLKYVISQGDPGSTRSAKDTILYAIIGVVVAILAYAAVNFVVARIAG